jgi:hypothetical protein
MSPSALATHRCSCTGMTSTSTLCTGLGMGDTAEVLLRCYVKPTAQAEAEGLSYLARKCCVGANGNAMATYRGRSRTPLRQRRSRQGLTEQARQDSTGNVASRWRATAERDRRACEGPADWRGRSRPGRTRTCNPRFWRPVLYQLSYGPRTLGVKSYSIPSRGGSLSAAPARAR